MPPEPTENPVALDAVGRVDLVRLISNEFGTTQQIVRSQVAMGQIMLDGVVYQPEDRFFIPLDHLRGKHVNVIGPDRSWQFDFHV